MPALATEITPAELLANRIEVAEAAGYRYAYGSLFPPVYDVKGNPRGLMPDWMIEAHCCRATRHSTKMKLEEGLRPKEYQGFGFHLRRFVEIIWHKDNPVMGFEFNTNATLIFEELFNGETPRFLGISGHKSCVSGDTRLLNPVTGERPTIKSLCERQERPTVMTLNGPAMAGVPFLKGKETLYEFKLSNGEKFKCTAKHRLLTPSGWRRASELSLRSVLYGFSPSLQESTSEPDLSAHALDVHRCSEKAEDSRSYCRRERHLCDARPHSVRGIARDAPPSRADAQRHTSTTFSRMDGHAKRSGRSPDGQCGDPSSCDASRRMVEQVSQSPRCASGTSLPREPLCQQSSQSRLSTFPLDASEEQVPCFDHTRNKGCAFVQPSESELQADAVHGEPFLSEGPSCLQRDGYSSVPQTDSQSDCPDLDFSTIYPCAKVTQCCVLSITKCEEEDFYDLEVPGEHHYLAEGAVHHNSGKTQSLAVIAVALFLVNPFKTKCIATSYTIQTGDDKIFGVIKVMWQAACAVLGEAAMPGRLKASDHKIVLVHPDGFVDDTKGIELIAGEQAKSKKSSARLQGIKAEYIFVAADELATLSHAIVKTCKENLATANKNVWITGSWNPDHYYDGAMEMAKPIDGWDSITVDSLKWKTLLGDCLHFDGLKSPNVIAGYEKWKGLYTREQLTKDKEWYGGEKTHGFWQMIRAFWSPTGSSDAIYSGQEIETYHADRPCGTGWYWADMPTLLAGLDPSFRPGGDRAVAYSGKTGQAIFEDGTRRNVFEFVEYEVLAEDVTKGQDKPRQVAEAFKEWCESRGITIDRTAVDVTGAAAFASLLRAVWGDGFLEVIFSESASDSPVSDTDPRPANECYSNHNSEIWYSAKPMMRSQQIKGIHPDMADEMCNRTYKEVGGKIKVESKEDMKARTGKSPDISDAGFVCLALARQNYGLVSAERSKNGRGSAMTNDQFIKWAEQISGVKLPYLEFEG